MQPPQRTILYFEDDTYLAEMFKTKFELAGFRVFHYASPAPDPVALAIRIKPDLILMDTIMPKLDGFHAAAMLKADDRTKSIPIFGLSNLGQPEDIEQAHTAGMSTYWVTAKHNPDEVIQKVEELVGVPSRRTTPRA